MKEHFRGRAIILSRRDVGEADRIIRVFFEDRGREAVSARGVRKPQAKLRGMLEPTMEVELQCVESKGLSVVTGAALVEPHESLMHDYDALVAAQGILEITEKTLAEHSSESNWYEFLRAALGIMSAHPQDASLRRLVWVTALIKNLHNHGISPVLQPDLRYLQLRDGVFSNANGVELSAAALKLWRVCREYRIEQLAKIQGIESALIELEPIVQAFWSMQTGNERLRTRSLVGS